VHGLIAPSFISRVPPLFFFFFFFFSRSSCHNSFSFLFAAALRVLQFFDLTADSELQFRRSEGKGSAETLWPCCRGYQGLGATAGHGGDDDDDVDSFDRGF
jgi:hypothetical protein